MNRVLTPAISFLTLALLISFVLLTLVACNPGYKHAPGVSGRNPVERPNSNSYGPPIPEVDKDILRSTKLKDLKDRTLGLVLNSELDPNYMSLGSTPIFRYGEVLIGISSLYSVYGFACQINIRHGMKLLAGEKFLFPASDRSTYSQQVSFSLNRSKILSMDCMSKVDTDITLADLDGALNPWFNVIIYK